jgi:hypothetical protein
VYLHFGEEGKSWFKDTLLGANVAISDVMLFAVIFSAAERPALRHFRRNIPCSRQRRANNVSSVSIKLDAVKGLHFQRS